MLSLASRGQSRLCKLTFFLTNIKPNNALKLNHILLFLKMERSPVITPLFHLRILSLIGLLIILDLNFVHIAYNHTLVKGASVQLVFGFEVTLIRQKEII